MTNLRIECQICRGLYQIIGLEGKLKGCLLINPLRAICYLCARKKPPHWNEQKKEWEKFEGGNHV